MSHYRGYNIIQNEAGRYVARPNDGEDLSIHSADRRLITNAIDSLWSALRMHGPVDQWIRDWLADPTDEIDLDRVYVGAF